MRCTLYAIPHTGDSSEADIFLLDTDEWAQPETQKINFHGVCLKCMLLEIESNDIVEHLELQKTNENIVCKFAFALFYC